MERTLRTDFRPPDSAEHEFRQRSCASRRIFSGWFFIPIFALARTKLCCIIHALDLGCAEGRVAVHKSEADLDFSGLAVGVSGSDVLSEDSHAAHLRFDPAPGVVSRPALLESPPIVSGGAQGFVAHACRRTVFLPRPTILADRNDQDSVAREDHAAAPVRVIGAIGGHGADLFVCANLV